MRRGTTCQRDGVETRASDKVDFTLFYFVFTLSVAEFMLCAVEAVKTIKNEYNKNYNINK